MLHGRYPRDVLAKTASITDWSFVLEGDTEIIHQKIDVLGANYYSTSLVRMRDGAAARAEFGASPWPGADDVEFLPQPGPFTSMGWNIEPSGLKELLRAVHAEFPDLPVMVIENGAAFEDLVTEDEQGTAVHDDNRIVYLRRHLTAVHRALEAGVDLRGYFVWSLLDNFEWSFGYSMRFGNVRVDFESLERIPKDSAHWYTRLAATHTIAAGRG